MLAAERPTELLFRAGPQDYGRYHGMRCRLACRCRIECGYKTDGDESIERVRELQQAPASSSKLQQAPAVLQQAAAKNNRRLSEKC
jgi:hypothetical protein